MSIEQPFFCDRFSVEDYTTVAKLRRAFHHTVGVQMAHYEPVLLNPGGSLERSDHRICFGNSGVYEEQRFSGFDFKTARWKFAEEVYIRALERTRLRFPLLTEIYWSDLYPNWRELVLPKCFSDAADFMISEMERITRSGGIAIDIGCSLTVSPPNRWNLSEESRTTLNITLDLEKITYQSTTPIIGNPEEKYDLYAPRSTVAYEWNDIVEFICRPTLKEVELLNYWDAKPSVQPLDLEMIDRVARLDIDGALKLVDQGANINGSDKEGETALTTLAEASTSDHIPFGDYYEAQRVATPEIKIADRIAMMRRLLNAGANPNLFFYQEVDVLVRATLQAEAETVMFLLEEAGVDPNHNTYPEDDPEVFSQALEYASSDSCVYAGMPVGDACEEIYQMLLKHGAIFRIKQNSD